jgi:hypothetical protein
VKKLEGDLSANAHGIVDIGLKVVKSSKKDRAAICIPSEPLDVCHIQNDLSLRNWWDNWQHNITLSMGTARGIGSLFFVLKRTETEDYANCYYEGEEVETELTISGSVANVGELAFHAGFAYRESGHFGFKRSPFSPGDKWTIFIKSLKGYIFSFTKLRLQAERLFQYV